MLSSKRNVTAGIAPGPTCEMPGADGASPAIQNAMDNAVTIEFKVDGKMKVAGSGFWVGGPEGRILATNNHVVKGILAQYPDPKKADIFVRPCGGDRKGELIEVKVGEKDPGNDLALLISKKPTDYSGITIAPEGSADLGETVWVLGGIGGLYYRCVLDKGSISALEADLIADWPKNFPHKESVIIVDGDSAPGNSGSAVIDALGRVIGVVFGGVSSTTVTLIVKSEKLTPLIERQLEIRKNSMTTEPAVEEGLSALFMDVDEIDADLREILGMSHVEQVPDGDLPVNLLRYDNPPQKVNELLSSEDVDEIDADLREILGMSHVEQVPDKIPDSDMPAVALNKRPPDPPPEPPCPPEPDPSWPPKPDPCPDRNTNSLHQQWVEANPPNEQDSLSSVDWGREFAVGKAFADLLAGGPSPLFGLPGSIGGPIGGIEVEPELDFGPGFDVPLA